MTERRIKNNGDFYASSFQTVDKASFVTLSTV